MRRYAGIGKNVTLRQVRTSHEWSKNLARPALYESPEGVWVLHEEAQAEVEKAYAEGREAGSKTVMVNTRTGLEQAHEEGYDAGYLHGQAAQVPVTDKHVERLLNELYHDRARLERAVNDAVELCQTAMQLEETERDDSEYVLGLLQQFVDTHEGG